MDGTWACPFCLHPSEGHTVAAQGCERPDCLCFYLPRARRPWHDGRKT